MFLPMLPAVPPTLFLGKPLKPFPFEEHLPRVHGGLGGLVRLCGPIVVLGHRQRRCSLLAGCDLLILTRGVLIGQGRPGVG
jgi:hypothetical protein